MPESRFNSLVSVCGATGADKTPVQLGGPTLTLAGGVAPLVCGVFLFSFFFPRTGVVGRGEGLAVTVQE